VTYERVRRIAELRAEIARLEAEQRTEDQMLASGWTLTGTGAYRLPWNRIRLPGGTATPTGSSSASSESAPQ
jgi:hypothetical protein